MKVKLSEEEKIFIILNYKDKTIGRLSQIMNKSRSTIYFFYKKWLATKTILNLKKTGRKAILNERQIKTIESYTNRNPLSTIKYTRRALGIRCGLTTMYKTVKKFCFKCLRYQRKPKISAINIP
jgi:transposase